MIGAVETEAQALVRSRRAARNRERTPVRHPWLLGWAIAGVSLLLAQASVRLGLIAWQPWSRGASPTTLQWAVLLGWTGLQIYAEGIRGFQRSFCPRVVGRAFHLAAQPRVAWWQGLLAPLVAMGLVYADRRQLLRSWGIVAAIVLLVLLVHLLQQPWRGIVDTGVVAGLVWGLLALWWQTGRALRHGPPPPQGWPARDPAP